MTLARVLGLVAAVLATAALAALSHVPLRQPRVEVGVLRLTWSARPERVETCREQSPAALESLPAHMRLPTICEGVNASYRLIVTIDGRMERSAVLVSGGLRRDRPIYVFEEIDVTPGARQIGVRLDRIEADDAARRSGDGRGQEDARLRRGELMEALPPALVLSETLTFAPSEVRVISYSPERRELFEVMR